MLMLLGLVRVMIGDCEDEWLEWWDVDEMMIGQYLVEILTCSIGKLLDDSQMDGVLMGRLDHL